MSHRAVVACSVLLSAMIVGCGGQHRQPQQPRPTTTGTPATNTQVLTLARVLESNFEHGGARFTASLQVDGQPVLATGRVDFRSGRGAVLVSPADPAQSPPRQYFWTRTTVFA